MPFAPRRCGMQPDWLSRRVTLLEQRVERLEGLPAELSALRTDMNAGFAGVSSQFAAVRAEMHTEFAAVRAEMDARFDAVPQVLISLQTQVVEVRKEMLRLHDDTMRHMRVLHEGVIDRIAKIKG